MHGLVGAPQGVHFEEIGRCRPNRDRGYWSSFFNCGLYTKKYFVMLFRFSAAHTIPRIANVAAAAAQLRTQLQTAYVHPAMCFLPTYTFFDIRSPFTTDVVARFTFIQ